MGSVYSRAAFGWESEAAVIVGNKPAARTARERRKKRSFWCWRQRSQRKKKQRKKPPTARAEACSFGLGKVGQRNQAGNYSGSLSLSLAGGSSTGSGSTLTRLLAVLLLASRMPWPCHARPRDFYWCFFSLICSASSCLVKARCIVLGGERKDDFYFK